MLDGGQPITHCPADHIAPEMEKLATEIKQQAKEKGIKLAENEIDDVLIVALFPQIGWKFLENRGNPDAFEPAPTLETAKPAEKPAAPVAKTPVSGPAVYTVELEGKSFVVKVTDGEKSVRLPLQHKQRHNLPRHLRVEHLSAPQCLAISGKW